MRITAEMVMKAYKDISGEGKAMRSEFFEETEEGTCCCGLTAIFLQKHGGTLGDVNQGIGHHVTEINLDRLQEEPQAVILPDLQEHFEVSESYLTGWMVGFDGVSQGISRPLHFHADHWKEGHEDGNAAGKAVFKEEDEN